MKRRFVSNPFTTIQKNLFRDSWLTHVNTERKKETRLFKILGNGNIFNSLLAGGVYVRVSIFPEKNFHFGNGMIRKFVA